MSQLHEAIARYHRLLESEPFNDLAWADTLTERMREHHLSSGTHRVAPVLRPHFITQRQYTNLVRATESLHCAMDRIERLALSTPALLSRMAMLPAEKMLAAVDPGYSYLSVTSLLDAHLNNGSLHVIGAQDDAPAEVVSGDVLNDLFFEAPPMVEFRKKTPILKLDGSAALLSSVFEAWHEFGGKVKPNIGILEFRQPFHSGETGETALLLELFRKNGYETEIVSPDQLEYRNGILRRAGFEIQIIYRRIRVSEFLMRFDLNHPLVRAYRDRSVCVINCFRSELSRKRAVFDLLTDDSVTQSFPAAERKAIREFIPWTRVVAANNTTYREQNIDLPAFIQSNREKLVLRPNDDDGERQTFVGTELDDSGWERAMKTAMRGSYVVQEVSPPLQCEFPLHRYGSVEMKQMNVDVHPHAFLGKVTGCSAYVAPAGKNGFSTVSGLAPTFILETR